MQFIETQHKVSSIQHTVSSITRIVYIVYDVQYTICSLTLVYNMQYTMYSLKCIVCSIQRAVYIMQYIMVGFADKHQTEASVKIVAAGTRTESISRGYMGQVWPRSELKTPG